MFKGLYPKEYLQSAFLLRADKLKKLNIDTVIFDVDNTLVPYFVEVPDDKTLALFNHLKSEGIKIAVLSNGKEKRVKKFLNGLDIVYIYRARKPSVKKLKVLLDIIGSESKTSAIVGDQIFTDVWCGNRLGLYTVLVKQVSPKDEFITWTKRGIERIIVKMYLKGRE